MGDVVVIGVGNEYRRDDGLGPAVLELLRGTVPDGVRLAYCPDGEPADLVGIWEAAAAAFVVDAVRVPGGEPGRVHRVVVGAGQPFAHEHPASSHGLGLGTAIEFARVLDRLPPLLVVYAVEGAEYGTGAGLSAPVAEAAERVAAAIRAEAAVPR